jgi:IS6 family transposase
VISVVVRWYLRYNLSYRDAEELLAERGITVDHVTIHRWVQRLTPEFIEAARFCRRTPGRPGTSRLSSRATSISPCGAR